MRNDQVKIAAMCTKNSDLIISSLTRSMSSRNSIVLHYRFSGIVHSPVLHHASFDAHEDCPWKFATLSPYRVHADDHAPTAQLHGEPPLRMTRAARHRTKYLLVIESRACRVRALSLPVKRLRCAATPTLTWPAHPGHTKPACPCAFAPGRPDNLVFKLTGAHHGKRRTHRNEWRRL